MLLFISVNCVNAFIKGDLYNHKDFIQTAICIIILSKLIDLKAWSTYYTERHWSTLDVERIEQL